WTSLEMSPSRDYLLLDVDKETLQRAPGFDPKEWPNMSDAAWRTGIHNYYGGIRRAAPAVERPFVERPVVERKVYVERPVRVEKKGIPVLGAILLLCLVLGLAWMTFLVSTRGWDQAKQDMKSSLQGAAYAAKETSHDAA